jgi:hypothetical protein
MELTNSLFSVDGFVSSNLRIQGALYFSANPKLRQIDLA